MVNVLINNRSKCDQCVKERSMSGQCVNKEKSEGGQCVDKGIMEHYSLSRGPRSKEQPIEIFCHILDIGLAP